VWTPDGRLLVSVPSEFGAPATLASGFQRGDVRWARPTDVVAGPDRAVYVADDTAGAIYRLTPP
jgi:glucose/arabinose dehydrogenase